MASSTGSSQNMRPMTRTTTTTTTSSPARGVAAIVGVGPDLGRSIACKFAHEGHTVAILDRDLTKLSHLADEIARDAMTQVFAITIDCSDSKSVREAFEGVLSLGFVEVLVYNGATHDPCVNPARFLDIQVSAFEKSLAVSAVGALHCSQQVIPGMLERGKGTIIFTGSSASLNGIPGYCELSCGKFALRGLSQCLAKEFRAYGIHVAHVIIDGKISAPRSLKGDQNTDGMMDPDAVAQTYWHLHTQDKSAWTQEIDLRP